MPVHRADGGGITIGDTILAFPAIRTGRLALPFRHGLESEQCYTLFDRSGRQLTSAETFLLKWLSEVVRYHQTEVEAFLLVSGIDIYRGRKGLPNRLHSDRNSSAVRPA